MIRISSVVAFLLAAAPGGILAQESIASDEDFFAESPLVLTVSRMSKPMHESPASVSIIDREMIAASGVRELADLLRLAPGFVVGYNLGHAPAVSYQGLGQEFGRQIQVLIDGRSVFIPSFGGVPWSNLPLLIDDIERIEVIRGPNAVTYGANAFLATINIITRHAAEDVGGQISIAAGNNNQTDIEDSYLRVGGQQDDMDWRLSMGTLADSGYRGINDSKSVGKINFRLDYAAPANQFWTAQFGSSSSQLGRGNTTSATNPQRDEDASNSYLNLQWEAIQGGNTTTLRLTHTAQEVTDHFDPGPFELEIDDDTRIPGVTTYIDYDRSSERSDLELIQSDEVSDSVRLVYGGGLRRDNVKSLYLFNDTRYHQVESNRLFGGVEWRPDENWLLDIGSMYEDSSLTDAEFSHRVSLIRHLGERHALRLVTSTARRNPILYEVEGNTQFPVDIPGVPFTIDYPLVMGNENVESEEIEAAELGLHSQWTDGIDSDIRLFDYSISNMLDETNTAVFIGPPINGNVDVITTINEDSVDVQGVEFALGYATSRQFRLNFGASLVNAESTDEDIEQSFPDFTGFWLATFRPDDRQEISAAFYYMDEISWFDSQDDIPIARKFDMRYRYRVHDRLEFELVGQNLLEDTTDYNEEKVHERLLYFGLTAGF